jgi:hypothetical protein
MNYSNEEEEYKEFKRLFWDIIPSFLRYSSNAEFLKELSDIIEEVERRKALEKWVWEHAEREYEYYDQKYGSEYWWQTLKRNWGDKGVKNFIFELWKRCLIQGFGPEVLEKASAYGSVEEAIRELEKEGLFPSEVKVKDPRIAVIRSIFIDYFLPLERHAKTAEEFALKVHRWFGVKVTADDVKKILEEELAKLRRGEKVHILFEFLGREGWKFESYLWNSLRLKSLEEHVRKWTLQMVTLDKESLDEARKWIMEELEKPPEEAHENIKLYRWVAEKLVK